MNTPAATTPNRATSRHRCIRAVACAGGLLAASVAHAGAGELAVQTVQGVLGFFADPENVRGVFGAAAGALASVLAARPLSRRSTRESDDT